MNGWFLPLKELSLSQQKTVTIFGPDGTRFLARLIVLALGETG
jgi:hypothetical protein